MLAHGFSIDMMVKLGERRARHGDGRARVSKI
jgi:hypothetical protein